MGSVESGGAPLLNDYKLDFFWKRFPQTLFGGPKLKLGYDAPFYVYINQVVVFLMPFMFGGLFTFLAEYEVLTPVNCCYIYGCIIMALVFVAQILSWQVRKHSTNVTKLRGNVLAQDDEINFASCCGAETVDFVFSGKKFTINMFIHAVFSGAHCGLLFLYLLPSTLNVVFGNAGVTGLLYAVGWLTLCVSQYSLTVSPPPEPATFRALDTWEIAPLMRPYYTVMCGLIGILANVYSELTSLNFALHVLFCILPLLWIVGVLPPLDALFAWAAEQGLVLVLGGSPMASDFRYLMRLRCAQAREFKSNDSNSLVTSIASVLPSSTLLSGPKNLPPTLPSALPVLWRLLVMMLLSSAVVVMATFVPSYPAVMVLAAAFGYILSTDIFGLGIQLRNHFGQLAQPGGTDWGVKECIVHLVMLSLASSLMAVGYHYSSSAGTNLAADFDTFGFVFISIVVVLKVLGDIQGVYVLFGLFRNPFYPASIHSTRPFLSSKRRLAVISMVYHILLRSVAPLLMVTFLGLHLHPEQLSVGSFAIAIGTIRASRQVWQNTFNCLLDMSIVVIIDLTLWDVRGGIGLGLQLMLVGVCRDRIQQLANKLSFLVTLTVTSWTLPKQRHPSTVAILVLSMLFLPVLLAIVASAAALSAPLLPLFCLPIFLIGFPRPLRSWPRVGANKICSSVDAIYYKQLSPNLVSCLKVAMATGALGNPAPGDHYLVRFQDRMVWVQVLECGYRFCSLVVKGLELQETSCHTVEAARVDDVFEGAFVREDKWPLVSVNPHPGNVLRPCDALTLDTYSDANNVLTGIIDQPDNLKRNSENFLKTLVWVLLNHCKDKHKEQPQRTSYAQRIAGSQDTSNTQAQDTCVVIGCDKREQSKLPDAPQQHALIPDTNNKTPKKSLTKQWSQDDMELDILSSAGKRESFKESPVRKSDSLPSFSGSIWSQDSFKFEGFTTGNDREKLEESFNLGGFPAANIGTKDNNDNHEALVLGGFPAGDVGKPPVVDCTFSGFPVSDARKPLLTQPTQKQLPQDAGAVEFPSGNASGQKPVQSKPPEFTSNHSHCLDLPSRWKRSPLESAYVNSLWSKFPTSWYKFVLKSLDDTEELANDELLTGMYQQLVCTCYALVNMLGYPGSSALEAGPSHVFKTYSGQIPWSVHQEWLTSDLELKELVSKAYRYAFKLTYDEAVLGDVSSEDEIREYLTEYDTDWYLGSDTDRQWEQAVLCGTPTLFSIGKDKNQGTYTSRVLTKQGIMAPVGRINSEAVRGQWASLALELLYLTNDDEERYSIQAHPVLLRNLTIQAADPPLGYPVFASGAMSVSLALHPL